jgi:hypothetical protein
LFLLSITLAFDVLGFCSVAALRILSSFTAGSHPLPPMDHLEMAVQAAVAGDMYPDDGEDYTFNICSPEFCTDDFRMYDFKVRAAPSAPVRAAEWQQRTACPAPPPHVRPPRR